MSAPANMMRGASAARAGGCCSTGSTGGPRVCRKNTTSRMYAYELSVPVEASQIPLPLPCQPPNLRSLSWDAPLLGPVLDGQSKRAHAGVNGAVVRQHGRVLHRQRAAKADVASHATAKTQPVAVSHLGGYTHLHTLWTDER
jgi:hypothetical protein